MGRSHQGLLSVLCLAVSLLGQAQEAGSLKTTFEYGGERWIPYALRSAFPSAESQVETGDDATAFLCLGKNNNTTNLGGDVSWDGHLPSLNFVRARAGGSGDSVTPSYIGLSNSVTPSKPGTMAGVDTITPPSNCAESPPLEDFTQPSESRPSDAGNGGTGAGSRARDTTTVPGAYEDSDRPHFTVTTGTEVLSKSCRLRASPKGNRTSSTSLAPGWKPQTARRGDGVWIGGCVFALAWAVMLC